MIYTKYLFTPLDLSNFIFYNDLTYSRQKEVLKDLFDNHNEEIVSPFRDDFIRFQRAVNDILIKDELTYEQREEAEMIMHEVNGFSTETTSEPDYYGAYFKLIKLRLLYAQDYCKIKMKNLLSDFGYQRRSEQLLTRMNRAINRLGIVPYKRGYESCNLATTGLDDTIIFRIA